jgi:hypothetical protein
MAPFLEPRHNDGAVPSKSGAVSGSGALGVPAWEHDPLLECSMTRPRARDPIYRRRKFEGEIIERNQTPMFLDDRFQVSSECSYHDQWN